MRLSSPVFYLIFSFFRPRFAQNRHSSGNWKVIGSTIPGLGRFSGHNMVIVAIPSHVRLPACDINHNVMVFYPRSVEQRFRRKIVVKNLISLLRNTHTQRDINKETMASRSHRCYYHYYTSKIHLYIRAARVRFDIHFIIKSPNHQLHR